MNKKLKPFLFLFSLLCLIGRPESLSFPAYRVGIDFTDPPEKKFALNRHQTLLVSIKSESNPGSEVIDFQFDARMPQHGHGMVTKPKIEKVSALKYRVKGVRLHMPGDWVLEFLIRDKNGVSRMEVPLNIPAE